MVTKVDRQINDYFLQGEWKKARSLIKKELREDKKNHWLITRLAETYYEECEYEQALKLEEKALSLKPQCPLVLWDYASTLDMLRQETKAIQVWKKLLARGEEDIAYGECGEGIRWARSLLNDCRYRIALAYRDLRNIKVARQYLKNHIANRSPGIPSLYPLASVKKKFSQLGNEYVGSE